MYGVIFGIGKLYGSRGSGIITKISHAVENAG